MSMNAVVATTATSSASLHSRSRVTTQQRMLVRRQAGAQPFVWAGLLPLLGLGALALYALLPFARNDIQATVHRDVQAQLQANQLAWVKLSTSGQNVLLTGAPPDPEAAAKAVEAARTTQCTSWLGLQRCVVTVFTKFTAPAGAALPEPVAAPQAVAAAAALAQACEKALADELAGQRIEFATGSAVIAEDSFALLDRLTKAAKSCPAKLRVEGHTDSVGNAAANQRLSQARAEAVRQAMAQRGFSTELLGAQGFGASKPVGSNDTPEGRASNRRIEFHADPGN
jgi:outer membrane protein OmpA-like peptidoglycan-associated protein